MKLQLFISRLIRNIEKKIGKKQTLEMLDVNRVTVYRWKNNYYELSIDQLENICRVAADVLGHDLRSLFIDGLMCIMDDRLNKKNEELIEEL